MPYKKLSLKQIFRDGNFPAMRSKGLTKAENTAQSLDQVMQNYRPAAPGRG